MQNVTENIDVGKLLDNWDETHELTKDEAFHPFACFIHQSLQSAMTIRSP